MTITPDQMREMREVCENLHDKICDGIADEFYPISAIPYSDAYQKAGNALNQVKEYKRLIAFLPALLDEVERLQTENERLREIILSSNPKTETKP